MIKGLDEDVEYFERMIHSAELKIDYIKCFSRSYYPAQCDLISLIILKNLCLNNSLSLLGGEKSGKWETKKTKKFPSQKRQRGLPKSEKPPQSAVLPSILESTALSKQTQLCLQAIPLLSAKLNNYRF